MNKSIHADVLRSALAAKGWTQAALAEAVGVTPQAVTNWIKGTDFPRPDKLLKVATTLKLGFDQLVKQPEVGRPIVAFRKRAGTKTTEAHIQKAQAMGQLLKPLVEFLPDISTLRTLISSPTREYSKLQSLAGRVRAELGIGNHAVLAYELLIGKFKASGGVLIPVLWGQKLRHENALHILLPDQDVTFVFLNLDARLEDFKFWMAHELAHVYTPDLAGTNEGEDFADALAGAVLFPEACASEAYSAAVRGGSAREIAALQSYADKHQISLYTVYQQAQDYAKARGLPALCSTSDKVHAVRNSGACPSVAGILFDPLPPAPARYIAACENQFQSDFFKALRRMIHERGIGPAYVQQLLDIGLQDAHAIYEELGH